VAEVQKVPIVSTCTPTGAFAGGNKDGWNYSWDLFFSEQDQASSVFDAFKLGGPARKVALFTDTEPDGVAERELYKQAAAAAGFTIVGDYTFPVGTSDFASSINDAKANGAELVIAQTIPPDGIALWQQMSALALAPQMAFSAKAAVSGAWWDTLGDKAEGTLTEGFWSADQGFADSDHIMKTLGSKIDNNPDLGVAVISLTAAQVLFDAIATGGTDPKAINDAIKATHGDYPLGSIKFNDNHVAVTTHLITQWTKGNTVQIIPTKGGTAPQVPPAGLG
jgi:branched-chain amino acid transport system substrate-binding protein